MKNPSFMLRNCPVACEACVQACKNQRADCAAWAREGECESNAGFMYRTCPESCGGRSSQAGAQTPQLVGQFFSMKSTLESHSPEMAQAGHSEEVSYATSSHWPQAWGHVRSMR